MSRLNTINPAEAKGATAEIFNNIKKSIGKVPNAYATIGTHSPEVLVNILGTDAVLAKSTLSKTDVEVVKLTVSELVGCDYCVAAHSYIGKFAGLSEDVIKQVRFGNATGDVKQDALVQFVRKLVETSGTLPKTDLETLIATGYTERQVIEIALAISSITFTNLINRINDTVIDFPKAPQ
jgi:uncharacterized peroxidase-related enzyme